ncbi:hypothetical protein P9112_010180 [Eukaryota sp. TZLM1-RC]
MNFTVAIVATLLILSCFGNHVQLNTSMIDLDESFLWSNPEIWSPMPPSNFSDVLVEGESASVVLVLNHNITVQSLQLSHITLVLDAVSLIITNVSVFDNVILESTTYPLSTICTQNLRVLGNFDVVGLQLLVTDFAHLLHGDLYLNNSQIILKETAVLSVDENVGSDHKLMAWGDGSSGRTGTGDLNNPHPILPVLTNEEFIDVSAGFSHSLGLRADGKVFGWGSNTANRLVSGSSEIHSPTIIDSLDSIVQIAAGNQFSLARDSSGNVYSWGLGSFGRLGHGDTSDQTTPKRVNLISPAVDISAGSIDALAVLNNGQVQAWGRNNEGQLGDGTKTQRNTPILLPVSSIRKGKACNRNSHFITFDDHLLSTGRNVEGQLCTGDPFERTIPTYIHNYASFSVVQVECTGFFSIFLTSNGDVYSCGHVLGRRGTIPPHTPGKVDGLPKVSRIFALSNQPMALLTSGILVQWDDYQHPVPVNAVSGLTLGNIICGQSFCFAENYHNFPRVSGCQNSSIEVFGTIQSTSIVPLSFDVPVIIHSSGSSLSNNSTIRFDQHIGVYGEVISRDSSFHISSVFELLGGFISSDDLAITPWGVLSGFGIIESSIDNFGVIEVSDDIIFSNELVLQQDSELFFLNSDAKVTVSSASFTLHRDSTVRSSSHLSFITTQNFTLLGNTMFEQVELSICKNGHLIQGEMNLIDSQIIIEEVAVVSTNPESKYIYQLFSFGHGDRGKTGTGVTDQWHGLLPVHSIDHFISVSAGRQSTLAVTRNGEVYGWGRSVTLGHGSSAQFDTPTKVPNLSGVVKVSLYDSHALALVKNGDVYSWGFNTGGRLGHGENLDGSYNNEFFPRRITALSSVKDISTGSIHSLALIPHGYVMSWGGDSSRQLGRISTSGRSIPNAVNINAVKKIVGCAASSLFINNEGRLFATGNNDDGQLCMGHKTQINAPTCILNCESYQVVDVSCSPDTTVFLTADGNVFSCGGLLGRSTDQVPDHSPGKVEGLPFVKNVTAGDNVAYALSEKGVLYQWTSGTSAVISRDSRGLSINNVYAGHSSIFITFKHETVMFLGSNLSSLNIFGSFISDAEVQFSIPVKIASTGSMKIDNDIIVQSSIENLGEIRTNQSIIIQSGGLHSANYLESLQILIHKGSFLSGSDIINSSVFNEGTLKLAGELSVMGDLELRSESQISNTDDVTGTFALTVDGLTSFFRTSLVFDPQHSVTVHTASAQILDHVDCKSATLLIGNTSSHLEGTVSLTDSRLVIDEDAECLINDHYDVGNTLMAWGVARHGKSGTGTTNTHPIRAVRNSEEIIEVFGSFYHSVGLGTNGRVFAWGSNQANRLGIIGSSPILTPTIVDNLEHIVQISAGDRFSLARDSSGFVFSWGMGSRGRLGHGNANDNSVPTIIEGLHDVVDISAGLGHSLALTFSGEVYAWGHNSGRLGDLSLNDRLSPVLISLYPKTPHKVTACGDQSFVITIDNELFTTGINTHGELCLGDYISRNTFTPIAGFTTYKVVQVSCQRRFSAFLTNEGEVYSCGDVERIGRTTAEIPQHVPGRVPGLSNIMKISAGVNTVLALNIHHELYSWNRFIGASLARETLNQKIGMIATGEDTTFVSYWYDKPKFAQDDSSSLEVFGNMKFDLKSTINFDLALSIGSDGRVSSISSGMLFTKSILIAGILTMAENHDIYFTDSVALKGGTIEADNVYLNSSASFSGYGKIHATVHNEGRLEPTGELRFFSDLLLVESAELVFRNKEHNENQINLNGTAFLNGSLRIDFLHQDLMEGESFSLLIFDQSISSFDRVFISCATLFQFFDQPNSIDILVRNASDGISYRNFFIAPNGTNDECCGTKSFPCLSVGKVLERMGTKGVINLIEGAYNETHFDYTFNNVDLTFEGNFTSNVPSVSISSSLVLSNSKIQLRNIALILNDTIVVRDSDLIIDDLVIFTPSSSSLFDSDGSRIKISNVDFSSDFTEISDSHFFILANSLLLVEKSNFTTMSVFTSAVFSNISFTNIQMNVGCFEKSALLELENTFMDMFNFEFCFDVDCSHSDIIHNSPLIFASQSNILLDNVHSSDYNLQTIYATDSIIDVHNSVFSNAVSISGHFVFCNTLGTFTNVIFSNLEGNMLSLQKQSEFQVVNLTFVDNKSIPEPIIHSSSSELLLESINFSNSANSVLFVENHSILYMKELIHPYYLNLTLANSTAFMYAGVDWSLGVVEVFSSNVYFYSNFNVKVELFSGQITVESTSQLSSLQVSTVCEPFIPGQHSLSNDTYWMQFCEGNGVFVHPGGTIQNLDLKSGIVHLSNSSRIETVNLHSSDSIIYISNSTLAYSSQPTLHLQSGFLVGSGTLVLDHFICQWDGCVCRPGAPHCDTDCTIFGECNLCVEVPICGWSSDFGVCDFADSNGNPLNLKYFDWYFDSCQECQLINDSVIDHSIIQKFHFPTENLIEFQVTVPYVRSSFWTLDFRRFLSIDSLSSCSNGGDGLKNITNLQNLRSAPHSNLTTTFNNQLHLAYYDASIWSQHSPSCELVSYRLILAKSMLKSCSAINESTVKVYDNTPIVEDSVTIFVNLHKNSLNPNESTELSRSIFFTYLAWIQGISVVPISQQASFDSYGHSDVLKNINVYFDSVYNHHMLKIEFDSTLHFTSAASNSTFISDLSLSNSNDSTLLSGRFSMELFETLPVLFELISADDYQVSFLLALISTETSQQGKLPCMITTPTSFEVVQDFSSLDQLVNYHNPGPYFPGDNIFLVMVLTETEVNASLSQIYLCPVETSNGEIFEDSSLCFFLNFNNIASTNLSINNILYTVLDAEVAAPDVSQRQLFNLHFVAETQSQSFDGSKLVIIEPLVDPIKPAEPEDPIEPEEPPDHDEPTDPTDLTDTVPHRLITVLFIVVVVLTVITLVVIGCLIKVWKILRNLRNQSTNPGPFQMESLISGPSNKLPNLTTFNNVTSLRDALSAPASNLGKEQHAERVINVTSEESKETAQVFNQAQYLPNYVE